MTRRARSTLASLVGLAALLALLGAGCDGGDDGADAPPRAASGIVLEVSHPPLVSGGPAAWDLTVASRSGASATLTFATGQRGDVVLIQDGSQVYRWAEGRAFTQATASVGLPAGQERTFRLGDGTVDVPPGDYLLHAVLTSDPAPPPVERQVTVASAD